MAWPGGSPVSLALTARALTGPWSVRGLVPRAVTVAAYGETDSAVPAAAELQMSFNLATILRESAKSRPDQALMYFADRSFSYAEVDETSGRVASSLH